MAAQFVRNIRVPPVAPITRKKILVLGSGRVCNPVIQYINKITEYQVTIGTDKVKDAKAIANKAKVPGMISIVDINVTADTSKLKSYIKESDLCISLLPNFLHPLVLEHCLSYGVHMVTPSYTSEPFITADKEAAEKGITLMCELGLDPGIDHMLAMECIDEVHSKNGKINRFISYCGGLPALEDSKNPLRYKFSWSPLAVLKNTLNPARFLRDGQSIDVLQGGELMDASVPIQIGSVEYEGLPNRDSIKYVPIYGLAEAKDLIRGSLRYKGYCSKMKGLRKLGLLNENPHPRLQKDSPETAWRDIVATLLASTDVRNTSLEKSALEIVEGNHEVYEAIEQLGLLSSQLIQPQGSPLHTLAYHLENLDDMNYSPGQRDLTLLQHVIDVSYNGSPKEQHIISLEAYGHPCEGESAMALTVGLPVAMAAKMILSDEIKKTGLVLPLSKEVYQPMLAELRESTAEWAKWNIDVVKRD